MSKLSARWSITFAVLASLALVVLVGGLDEPHSVAAQPGLKTILVDPVQDTYAATAIELPLGSAANLRAGYWNGAQFLTYIQFEFPDELGDEASIVSAQLSLYCHNSMHENQQPTSMELRRVMSKWDEDQLIYKLRPNVSGPKIRWDIEPCWPKDDEDYDPGWRSVDVTDTVQRWYRGDLDNYGWELGGTKDEPEHRYTFHSRDEQPRLPIGLPPRLTINWIGGTTATFTPSATPTMTPTSTPTVTPTPTNTLPPTDTPTITNTPEVTDTPTPTPTPTARYAYLPITLNDHELMDTSPPALPTQEATEEPTEATPADTAEPTLEPTPEDTVEPTPEDTVEPTPEETEEPTP